MTLKKLERLKNYMRVARKVKEIVLKHDPKAEIYVFGSVVEGKTTAMSDIDILIISEEKELEYRVKVEVLKNIDAPLQIHYVTREEYEKWYKKFIKTMVRI